MAQADVALQLALQALVQVEMDTKVTSMTAIRGQLAARCAELSQLAAKHAELTEEFGRFELQSVAGDTASRDLKPVVETCERSAKHEK